jgi:rod shape determining protein RodA
MKIVDNSYEMQIKNQVRNLRWRLLHIDPYLLLGLVALAIIGNFILYSASNENSSMVTQQIIRMCVGFGLMFIAAQIPPSRFYEWAPWLFIISLFLLALVLVVGQVDQGARRWFNLHIFHLQPSEIMKFAMPMMLAWYLSAKNLPLGLCDLAIAGLILIAPVLLIAKQPDLGTALMIGFSGFAVLLFAGIRLRYLFGAICFGIISLPILWHFMHGYQKARVLTFLNPERDPLGAGYHIIQSKIAIGSGGFLGKGWLHGTQSHLSFLPAHATDFIFAVAAEEFGLIGCLIILTVFLLIFARALYICCQAQNTFTRLLAGSLSLTFLISAFVNIGMVIGILPVVGIPLPLISYGGSSLLVTMIAFGMVMSIHTHRKLWSS